MGSSKPAGKPAGPAGAASPAALPGDDSPGAASPGESLPELEAMLGFRFRDPSLLRRALTHRSYCNEHNLDATESYERLEFLGDSVLEISISAALFRRLPDATEGRMTQLRSHLVSGHSLARVARRLRLGAALVVGCGGEETGIRHQDGVLAAALEAVMAAIYLDQGLERASSFILATMAGDIDAACANLRLPDNPKGRLQELVQGQGSRSPAYLEIRREGPDHSPVFTIEVSVDGQVLGQGMGSSKSEAEAAAARHALQQLQPAAE